MSNFKARAEVGLSVTCARLMPRWTESPVANHMLAEGIE